MPIKLFWCICEKLRVSMKIGSVGHFWSMLLQISYPVYHVEKPRPFISPLTLYGHVTGFFTGFWRHFWSFMGNFSEWWPYQVRGTNVHGGLMPILHRPWKLVYLQPWPCSVQKTMFQLLLCVTWGRTGRVFSLP